MNIATAVLRYHTHGGVERAAVEISERLAAKGHVLTVFSCAFEGNTGDRLRHVRVPCIDSRTSSAIATFNLATRLMLKRPGVDIIHAHGVEPGRRDVVTAQSCHKAGLAVRSRITLRVRGSRNLHLADTTRLWAEHSAFGKGRYRKISAVSHGLKRELQEYYGMNAQDIVVIPNGVDLLEFSVPSPDERIRLRGERGLREDEFVLLFVGNEFERKGLDVVIDGMAALGSKRLRLMVVGRDRPEPFRDYGRIKGIGSAIRFEGLQKKRLREYYWMADAFIMPTFHESFLIAGLEAAACGLPLLITTVPGPEDYLVDGVNGMFIERNADDIATKIARLMGDVGLRRSMGLAAARMASEYSWDRVTEETLALYRQLT